MPQREHWNVWAKATFLVLFAAAMAFFGWDLKGGRRYLMESLQSPARAPASHTAGTSAPSNSPGQPNSEVEALKQEMANAEKQLEIDEKRLDALRSRAADIQLFVTILLGLGTLYAAAQALFAYLNIQTLLKNARDDVGGAIKSARDDVNEAIKNTNLKGKELTDEHKKNWAEFQADCLRRFPHFAGMDRVMRNIFAELFSLLAAREIAQNVFAELSPEERQKVFFYEKGLAGLEYFEIQQSAEDSLKVFRGLAIFYVNKYEFEKQTNRKANGSTTITGEVAADGVTFTVANPGGYLALSADGGWTGKACLVNDTANIIAKVAGNTHLSLATPVANAPLADVKLIVALEQPQASGADLERGKFYFKLALRFKENDFRILNDLGKMESEDQTKPRDASQILWRQSIAVQPDQQRAYYDLGTSMHEEGKYREAIELFEAGLRNNKWEDKPKPINKGSLHFNLACSLSRLAKSDTKKDILIQRALEQLNLALVLDRSLAVNLTDDADLQFMRSERPTEFAKLLSQTGP